MSNMLEALGLTSDAVYSAEAALDYLQYSQPDIIFLDHTMPGMNGLETIKVLKSNPITATVPVMMYTAKEGEVYVSQARALGAVDVLPKGLEKDYLYKALCKLGLLGMQKGPVASVNNTSETKKVETEKELPKEPTEQSQVPVLQSFWKHKIEPFLYRQRVQNSEELKTSTHYQTRKLTKEFHQTLEHFEHALFHRNESHEEFLNAKQDILEAEKKKRIRLSVFIVVVLQIFIMWQLWNVSQSNQQLLAQQESVSTWQEELSERLEQLDSNITSVNRNPSEERKSTNPTGVRNQISLIDGNGDVIAALKERSDALGYQGVTNTGYYFVVSSQGILGWPLKFRYFMSNDCQGNIFVNEANASIYRDSQNLLWYVDISGETLSVAVSSLLNEDDQCVSITNEVLNLRRLQPNVTDETGVDEYQNWLIYRSEM